MKVWLGTALFVILATWASYLVKDGLAHVRVVKVGGALDVSGRTPSLSVRTALSDIVRETAHERTRRVISQAFGVPIVFYGKVIDDSGNPVPQAAVHFYVATNPVEEPVVLAAKSDANGKFSLSGISGARLLVSVTKEGFHAIENESGGSIGYGLANTSPNRREVPSQEKPAVFMLRKIVKAVPLIVSGARKTVPRDGTPVVFELATGKGKLESRERFVIECWTQGQPTEPNSSSPYDWHTRLSIPGGGLLERTDKFAFEAPTEGYRPAVELSMPKDAKRWRQHLEMDYFVKLSSHHYGRVKVRITTGGAGFATLTSYLNPTIDARELDYDPRLQSE